MNDSRDDVLRYFGRVESRLGYRLLLNEARHFGWYEPGDAMWRFARAVLRMEQKLGSKLDLPHGSRVLDAGCGAGHVAITLARDYGLTVDGVDVSIDHVETARTRSRRVDLTTVTNFTLGDFHALDFEEGIFDGAYTMETVVHATQPARVVEEVHRILRPGGRLVMFEYSHPFVQDLDAAARDALRTVCRFGAMPGWLQLHHGELERILSAAGFVDIEVINATANMMPMLRAFSILARAPYAAMRLFGRPHALVNAMSAVEMYRHRQAFAYKIYSARRAS